jgi:phosphoglycolate phosphatase
MLNGTSAAQLDEFRLAVFDCDGTLVDSQLSIISCMFSSFDANNLNRPTPQAVREIVGLPLLETVRRLAPDVDDSTHEKLRDGYKEAFQKLRKEDLVEEALFPGMRETLKALDQAGWLLGVATGKGTDGLKHTLRGHGLESMFVTFQTADKARGKPHPEMLHNAMAEAGTIVANTVMIGDTTFDIEMAKNAGVRSIGVSWGYHEPEMLLKAGAAHIVDTMDDLLEAISSSAK